MAASLPLSAGSEARARPQMPPHGPLKLERADAGHLEVYFPWELDNTDYLRRVLSLVTQGVRGVYSRAVSRDGISKVRDYKEREKEPDDLDSHYALKHMKEHKGYYCRVFKLSLGALDDTISMLGDYRNRLAHESLGDSMPDKVLERAFSHVIHLAVKCSSWVAETNLRSLLRQWDDHRRSKQMRRRLQDGQGNAPRAKQQAEPAPTILSRRVSPAPAQQRRASLPSGHQPSPAPAPSCQQELPATPSALRILTRSRSPACSQERANSNSRQPSPAPGDGHGPLSATPPVVAQPLHPLHQLVASERPGVVESVLASSGDYPNSVTTLFQHRAGSTECMALSGDGLLLAAYAEGELAVCSTYDASGQTRLLIGHRGPVHALALSSDGRVLASCGVEDRTLRIWDTARAQELHSQETPQVRAGCVAISGRGDRVVVGYSDGSATVMPILCPAGSTCHLGGHTAELTSVAISCDGSVVATSSLDHSARVWDGITGEARQVFSFPSFVVNGLALSADGKLLATANSDSTATVFFTRREDGRHLCTVRGISQGTEMLGVALSADGCLLATCSDGSTASLWDTRPTGCRPLRNAGDSSKNSGTECPGLQPPGDRLLHVMAGHGPGRVHSIALTVNGALAATCGDDGEVMLWSCRSSQKPLSLSCPPSATPMG